MTCSPARLVAIAPLVRFAWRATDVVVLDIRTDTYFCLTNTVAALRPGPQPGTVLITDPILRRDLSDADLICEGPASLQPSIQTAKASLISKPRVGLAPKIGAVLNASWSTATFKRKTLAGMIATVRRRNARAHRTDPDLIARETGAFNAIQPWMPAAGDCLQRAYMLHYHLHRSGQRTRWIFGVRTWPFLAHCWLQADDLVVGDTAERVSGFTPILSV